MPDTGTTAPWSVRITPAWPEHARFGAADARMPLSVQGIPPAAGASAFDSCHCLPGVVGMLDGARGDQLATAHLGDVDEPAPGDVVDAVVLSKLSGVWARKHHVIRGKAMK